MSFSLPYSLNAWDTPGFPDVFCDEVARLPNGTLPLQQALSMGSHVLDQPPQVMLLSRETLETHYQVRAGVFFKTVLGGCNCADDPSPMDEHNEYCELRFLIDPSSGQTEVEPA